MINCRSIKGTPSLPRFGAVIRPVHHRKQSVTGDQRQLLNGTKYSYPDLGEESRRNEFNDHYAAKFGTDQTPTVNSFFVYDGLTALRTAIDTCKSADDGSCILDSLRSGKPRSGIGGAYTYTSEGTVNRDFILKEVIDGKFIAVPAKP